MSVKVEGIAMEGFFSHKKSLVNVPGRGVVVVTGPNGSGKSSIVEAVSVGLWGKTLRGTSPWPGDGCVRLMATAGQDGLAVERVRKGSKTSLSWGSGGTSTKYENDTKAQEALETVVGSWDVWRRSSAFSSQDASHFTLATDKQRKLLLESILGLDRFDRALESCRADIKLASSVVSACQRTEVNACAALEKSKEVLATIRQVLERDKLPPKPAAPKPMDDVALREELTALDAEADTIEADIEKLNDQKHELARFSAKSLARLEAAGESAKRLDQDACPTCGQAVLPGQRKRLREDFEAAGREHAMSVSKESETGRLVHEQQQELREELAELRKKRDVKQRELAGKQVEAQGAERAYRVALGVYQEAEKRVEAARLLEKKTSADVLKFADEHVAAKEALSKAEAGLAELGAVEQVLGLRGVRASILGKALAGIEAVANMWLSRLCNEALLSLELKPYSEKVTGGFTDSISVEVHGAGNGYGYKAASGGERRRIDVSLLLALSEVARASVGAASDTTLWFDEVFDALDSDGVEAVASALSDLAKDRAVVVLTHSEALAARVNAAVRIRVESGKVVTA